jgi:hypothetical protein
MTMAKSKDYRSGRDAQSAPSQLSIEDTATVRARFERGKPGPSAFDPYAGALPARPPTAKKDLRKLGEWIKAKRTAEELKREEAEPLVPRLKNPERP